MTLGEAGRQLVSVVDVTGKQIWSKSAVGPSQFDIPGMKNGVYFVKVKSSKKSEVRKVSLF